MAESDDAPLWDRLETAGQDEAAQIVADLHASLVSDPPGWAEVPSAEHVETLASLLAHDDEGVRASTVVLLSSLVTGSVFEENQELDASIDRAALAGRLLDCIDDEHRHVRQVAVSSGITGRLVASALDDESFSSKSRAWLARQLIARLHDPAPIVRKRVANYVASNAVEVLEAHPDTAAAVDSLVDSFDDDLDALAPDRDATTPRYAALRALSEYAAYDGRLVADRIDAITRLLTDPSQQVRWAATELLCDLRECGAIDLETIAPDVVGALEQSVYPLTERSMPLAVDVALVSPSTADTLARELRLKIGGERTGRPHHCTYQSQYTVEAIARLVTAGDFDAHPVLQTLTGLVDTVDFDETDPLVALADEHPSFVAEQLQAGYQQVLEGELSGFSRFDEHLVAEVAKRSRAAVEGVPAVLTGDLGDRTLLRATYQLSLVCPDLVAETFPEALAAAHRNPPVSTEFVPMLEATAGQWQGVPADVVDDLVATAEYTAEGYSMARQRRRAVRALVALYENGHDAVPERVAPFVEPCRQGLFDDERPGEADPVDPLETEAAAIGGWNRTEEER
ncbi:hypothetical protein [Haloarchaeobius sp. DYHT-AS-18]|uniref:hypothetical protein n=1 Tax=Haloarchaeobius sp. DYHT-AS-18 TaxID=3446117 RepID=UPI003EBEEC93